MATSAHTVHIPVMGIGFTIDSPLRLAHLGLSSVMSLVDDALIECMRRHHSPAYGLDYSPIPKTTPDYRARRIQSWLDLVQHAVHHNFHKLLNDPEGIARYMRLLPPDSELHAAYAKIASANDPEGLKLWAREALRPGSADVNIMTKLDRENYDASGQKLEGIYNDAHAALRGFALSSLQGAIVFSAGMNPKLYSYMEAFPAFFPKGAALPEKRIILKVSDFRSAQVQARFLVRKGLWVSEFRLESGLNCGGHAFATDGYLMGPILEDFKAQRASLHEELEAEYREALKAKGIPCPEQVPMALLSAQGGVGTAQEHRFLGSHYGVDAVGWGSPFLLVAEATNVDAETRRKLAAAREADLELSNISPLGVPFHNLKGNTKDLERDRNIDKGRPGSACPKRYIALNKEFSDQGICIASRVYQHHKLKELGEGSAEASSPGDAQEAVLAKSCICVGLGTSALLVNELDTRVEGPGVSVCPGPNMAYFGEELSLEQLLAHIYGSGPNLARADRPHMFLKELGLYLEFLEEKTARPGWRDTPRLARYVQSFARNLREGIAYYSALFAEAIPEQAAQAQAVLHAAEARIAALVEVKEQ